MSVHSFDRIPHCIVKDEDGNTLYEYICENCGIILVHEFLLRYSDFEYNDYHSDAPCDVNIGEDTTDDNG